ncbi:MAG TPA: TIM barrel protein [Acidimicrobiales bacterium]|nr:TIM barrel protein [Acidimicrobiales bacterium]
MAASIASVTVEFFRSLWGPMAIDGGISDLPAVCAETRRRGYTGVETNPFLWRKQVDEAKAVLDEHGLRLLARAHTFGATVAEHVSWVRRVVELAPAFGSPFVIAQSGADWFDDAQIDEYFTATAQIEAESGLRIAHETHRGCILNTPWVTARVLDRFPEAWLAADYSHWIVVCERYLETEGELLTRFAPRVLHIDARVGTPEAPQVADPRTDVARTPLAAFEQWWDEIHEAGNLATVVPEFGAAPYAPPDTADLDDVCQWMADRLRARWA